MKNKILSLAATILFAASVNTAFAENTTPRYYLIGAFNGWNDNTKLPFEENDGVYTLTPTTKISGEFKIYEVGRENLLGANVNGQFWLTKTNSEVDLYEAQNAAALYFQFEETYTFTIKDNKLSVNLDDLLIAGSFNDWKPQRMTAQTDGSYKFTYQNAYDGLEFKIVDFNNSWYCGGTGKTYGINDGWRSYISLSNSTVNGENFKLEGNPGACTFVVSSDFKLTVLGFGKNLVTLSDNTINDLSAYVGQTVDVVINGRTFFKDGDWNTICLPFTLTSFTGTLFSEADVKTLASSSFIDGSLGLTFESCGISAGTPCIAKWSSKKDNIVNPIFTNVEIAATTNPVETSFVNFVGNFSPENISGSNNLYIGAGNQLYYPSSTATINAFRAYFELNLPSGQQAKSFVLNFGDETTSITQINNNASVTDSYFTLDGRRLNDKPATAGLYIVNGKKVVIK